MKIVNTVYIDCHQKFYSLFKTNISIGPLYHSLESNRLIGWYGSDSRLRNCLCLQLCPPRLFCSHLLTFSGCSKLFMSFPAPGSLSCWPTFFPWPFCHWPLSMPQGFILFLEPGLDLSPHHYLHRLASPNSTIVSILLKYLGRSRKAYACPAFLNTHSHWHIHCHCSLRSLEGIIVQDFS